MCRKKNTISTLCSNETCLFPPAHEALETHGVILLAANDKRNPNELHSQQEKGKNTVWMLPRACATRS